MVFSLAFSYSEGPTSREVSTVLCCPISRNRKEWDKSITTSHESSSAEVCFFWNTFLSVFLIRFFFNMSAKGLQCVGESASVVGVPVHRVWYFRKMAKFAALLDNDVIYLPASTGCFAQCLYWLGVSPACGEVQWKDSDSVNGERRGRFGCGRHQKGQAAGTGVSAQPASLAPTFACHQNPIYLWFHRTGTSGDNSEQTLMIHVGGTQWRSLSSPRGFQKAYLKPAHGCQPKDSLGR